MPETPALIALLTTAAIFVGLFVLRRNVPVELLFLSGLVIVTLTGVISIDQALAGFSNKAVFTIGGLLIASSALRTTGAVDWIGQRLLGSATTERTALIRLLTVLPLSAVVINTPIVAMLTPVVIDWCRRREVSPSRLLIPLSYLAILGGVCTLIGTTTVLVGNGELQRKAAEFAAEFPTATPGSLRELSFLEITWAGAPCALAGGLYILFVAPRLLPNRTELIQRLGEQRREYLLEMLVHPTCPLIGKTVEQAGLRNLPGLFLIEIDRAGDIITPVAPQDAIQAHDRMIFTGVVTTIADLERVPGMVPAADLTYEFKPAQRTQRVLTEAVLSPGSPLIGRTVREANFRKLYNAAVVAVHRNGQRMSRKIGGIRLEVGDTLLLQTRDDFVAAHRNNHEFYLVSRVDGSSARRHDRAVLAMLLFAALVMWFIAASFFANGTSGSPWQSVLSRDVPPMAAIAIALAMIGLRCIRPAEARAALDLRILLTIPAALGLGAALEHSGAAGWLAEGLVGLLTPGQVPEAAKPWILFIAIYFVTVLCTELITNVAVVAMMLPIAIQTAITGGFEPRPFVIGVIIAASLSFVTPIGYQSNLLVMGPGGYEPRDYFKVGAPLSLLTAVISLLVIPSVWPFGS